MRMKLPRFGLRLGTAILLILAIGAGMAIERARARWAYCHAAAGKFRLSSGRLKDRVDTLEFQIQNISFLENANESALTMERGRHQSTIRELDARVRAFERAALLPWLPVPPGPSSVARPDF